MTVEIPSRYPPLTRPATAYPSLPGGSLLVSALAQYSMSADTVSRQGLMLLPSNRFEALGGDRKGQFSIRINQQWRICFEWPEHSSRPFNIEIVDYH